MSWKISELITLFYVSKLSKTKVGCKNILPHVSYHLIMEHSTQIVYILQALTVTGESGKSMPLTHSFKPIMKPNNEWINASPVLHLHLGMYVSRRLKTVLSKTAANYSPSSSLENTFCQLFWPYCFGLKSIASVSHRLTSSLSLVRSTTDHGKGEHCDLHSLSYDDHHFQNCLPLNSAPPEYIFQKSSVQVEEILLPTLASFYFCFSSLIANIRQKQFYSIEMH